ncbi:M48 family metallopeptidase [Bifidobacterium catenulatum]
MLLEETVRIAGMTVTIMRKPIKNMYLRIKPPNAQIVISAPSRMSQAAIARFVTERKPWIEQAQHTMLQVRDEQIRQSDFNGLDGVDGSNGPENLNGLKKTGGVGDRNNPGDPNSLNNPRAFVWNDATRRRAVQTINAQLPVLLGKWAPVIGRKPTHITLRIMTSRWGSCTPKTGRIRLNLQLGLMDPKFLEYVLVHEMTHLWENGHGEGFQRRMSAYLPQWRQLRRELNRHVVL